MAFRDANERETLLTSLEKYNTELAKLFRKYRRVKNRKIPDITEDENIDQKELDILVDLYSDHRDVLYNIIVCSKQMKIAINNFESFFKVTKEEKLQKKKIAEIMREHERRINNSH